MYFKSIKLEVGSIEALFKALADSYNASEINIEKSLKQTVN